MNEKICIEEIKMDDNTPLEHLNMGRMVVGAAKEEILYMIDSGSRYDVFVHIPGTPEGRRNFIPKSDHSDALVRNLCKIAENLYSVEYDKSFDLNSVLVAAERAVLSVRPPETIEFFIPSKKEDKKEAKEGKIEQE
jgi:hypothetical protein